MEALATAFPARFSAECRSLATPVASCAQQLMVAHATRSAVPGGAIADGEADAKEQQSVAAESSPPPPPPVARTSSGPSAAPAEDEEEKTAGGGRDGGENGDGAVPSPPPVVAGGRNSLAIEERRAMELWVDMLGICLLPFCGSGGGADGSVAAKGINGGPSAAAAGSEHADDPLDTDSEDEDDEDADDEGGGDGEGGGKARAGWVTGWMRRAGVTLTEPLACPLDIQPGGRDEELPRRLTVLTASHAKVCALAVFAYLPACMLLFQEDPSGGLPTGRVFSCFMLEFVCCSCPPPAD